MICKIITICIKNLSFKILYYLSKTGKRRTPTEQENTRKETENQNHFFNGAGSPARTWWFSRIQDASPQSSVHTHHSHFAPRGWWVSTVTCGLMSECCVCKCVGCGGGCKKSAPWSTSSGAWGPRKLCCWKSISFCFCVCWIEVIQLPVPKVRCVDDAAVGACMWRVCVCTPGDTAKLKTLSTDPP